MYDKQYDLSSYYDLGKRIRHIFTAPQNKEAIQPELNLFAVQMVSQPLYSARFLYWSDAFTPLF